ncbi:uncharacterized protein H6S33_001388 [Morchella sextelata]|uniref:uncharacterized protein n=1 Tax=Morchella sextelata TaxID=1174677 RepID=UPI001D039880|nr:uncharacterized protein H6S33_001388 [Morchella sextelata]KAH0609160.1 hypothetical protein H6S33_001388 [Morchella sextelata]
MFSSSLRTRAPWTLITPSLLQSNIVESPTLAHTTTTDIAFPSGLSVLLTTDDDNPTATATRVERALQTATTVVVVFLGSGVWGFQLLLDQTFREAVYVVPLFAVLELPGVLVRLVEDYSAPSPAGQPDGWTPARMLSLMAVDGGLLSVHSTLVLHSMFSSLRELAMGADVEALEVLEGGEGRGVVEFLEVEFVVGG